MEHLMIERRDGRARRMPDRRDAHDARKRPMLANLAAFAPQALATATAAMIAASKGGLVVPANGAAGRARPFPCFAGA